MIRLRSSRTRIAGGLLLVLALSSSSVRAQPYLPAPGGAPGADTGDAASPFVGLADTPRADLFSGAATTRVPISLPAGRGNATPSLALQYSSNAGTSAYGEGWSFPLPKIFRSTRLGVPRFDDTDTFVVSIGHVVTDLVPIAGTPRYRTDPEGSYLRIGFDGAANSWRVVDKSGTTFLFGALPDARLGPAPISRDGTSVWQLTRTIDTFGNHVDYAYVSGANGPSEGLPVGIRYGGNLKAGLAHSFSVSFLWETASYPSLPVSSYRGGFASERRRRLVAIEAHGLDGVARRYSLSHTIDPYTGHAQLVGVSLDGFAADPAEDAALPSTVFVYASPTQRDWPLGTEAARRARAKVFASPGAFRDFGDKIDFDTFDIDGDAIVDYVNVTTNPPTVRRGSLTGFGASQAWAWPTASRRIRKIDSGNDLVINVFDLTGDGLPDLVDARESECGRDRWCVYRNNGSGFAPTPEVWTTGFNRIRGADVDGRTVRSDVTDVTGDGRPDLVDATVFTSSYRYWHVYRNRGDRFDAEPVQFEAQTGFISRTASIADRSHLLYGLHDMNADGLPDFVRADVNDLGSPLPLSATHWDVHLNTGSGFEATPLEWRVEGPSGIRLHNYLSSYGSAPDTRRTETFDDLIDINGDGRLDWVRSWNGADLLAFGLEPLLCESGACSYSGTLVPPACCFQALVFVNTGSSFSHPMPWAAWHDTMLRSYSKNPAASVREFDVFDFDGDALLDLVEIEDGEWRVFAHPASPKSLGSATPESRRFRPNLMLAMMNGIGGETRLEYSPVSSIAGNRLAFPAWVIRRQETFDGVSQSPAGSTDFEYRGAAFDAEDNESRGFRLVWEQDPLGRVSATEFHQDDHRAGLIERVSKLGPGACATGDLLDPANPCSPWRALRELRENVWPESGPVLLNAHTATPFHGGQPIPELGKTIEYAYDTYGNVAAETVASPSAGAVTTETEYVHSVRDASGGQPSRYVVDRPTHSVTYDPALPDVPLQEKRYVYDAPNPETGALTAARTCIDWNAASCRRWQATDYQHDAVGNLVTVRDPNGGTTSLRYDPLRLYATRVRNALGAETLMMRDLATGRETRRVLPDGQVFETEYDGLGRPRRHRRSGSSSQSPVVESTYFEGSSDGAPSWVRTITAGAPPVVVFHDGLGRPLATKRWTETEAGVKAVVSGLRRYSPEGAVSAESVTFEATSSSLSALGVTANDVPAWTEYLRDSEGRLTETRLPDGTRVRHDSSTPGVRVTVNPNLASGEHEGTARIEFRDGLGRVWRKDECAVAPTDSTGTCAPGALLSRAEYDYDGLDRPVRIVIAPHTGSSASTTVRYDGLGNRVEHSSSNLGRWLYAHDDSGLLVEAVDPRGAKVVNDYDKLGRLHRQVAGDSRSAFKYFRRGLGSGLVRRISSRSGTTRVRKDFTYDARGRVVSESWRIRAEGEARSYAVAYTYDDADRRISVSYPAVTRGSSDVLRTAYTPYGLPFAVWIDGSAGRTDLVHAVSYDLQGNVTRVDYANGWSDRFAYTPAFERSRLRCTRTAWYLADGTACSSATGDLRRYRVASRDPSGNVISTLDSLHAGSALDRSMSHTYDALGRLTETRTPGGVVLERFEYDARGNLTNSSAVGGLAYGAAAPHLAMTAGGASLAHDAAGNRVRKGSWAYSYDALGRLSEIEEGGALVARNHYDEGRSRVARYDTTSDTTTFYFGGLVELDDETATRKFYFMDRVVASDTIDADAVVSASDRSTSRTSAGLVARSWLYASITFAALLLLGLSRRRIAVVTALAFLIATTLSPVAHAVPRDTARLPRAVATSLLFFHADERGSPELLTDSFGAVVEQRRYSSYGRLTGAFDAGGQPAADEATGLGFNGHTGDRDEGLVYFGARFYDPELGLFLTPDPQAQYASPYLYGGGNPIYGVDPDGEAIFAFLAAILQPIVASAVASSFVSAVTAAAQGGDVAGALVDGLVSGAAGSALGTALGGMNVAYQIVAGGAELIGLNEALGAVVEAARRSAFTNVVSHTAASLSRAVGADSDWATVVDLGVKLVGSYIYDNFVIRESGSALGLGGTQRAVAKSGLQNVNTTAGHASVTEEAAIGTGWENQSGALAKANVAQDGAGGFLGRVEALMNNESHFGRLPATLDRIHAELDGLVGGSASKLLGMNPVGASSGFVRALGGASHYVQDHLTLGHMVPGTALFGGPLGAPVRFVIHQVFGGEIAFRDAQVRATRALLARYGAPA